MANRRMFSKAIVNSSKFLRMPIGSRLLYYDFGMSADDDGFCEWYSVLQMNGLKEQDMQVLAANGFIKILDENVLFISEWKENNYLRSDRYSPSKYREKYGDIIGIPTVYHLDTQDRIGKDRIGKDTDSENEEKLIDTDPLTGEPIVPKKISAKPAPNNQKFILSVAMLWQKMASDHLGIPASDIPAVSLLKPIGSVYKRYAFTRNDFEDLFRYFLNERIPEDKKSSIYICLSDNNITQYKVSLRKTGKTNASISGDIKL